MFPHIPRGNIHYDLLKTGSVEITSNKLLERGYLEAAPPTYFQLFPAESGSPAAGQSSGQPPTAAISSSKVAAKSTLISRFDLEDRLRSEAEALSATTDAGGKATWEDTAERREASLRQRKEQMVLAARKRFLEQQQVAGISS
ncbi:hypothetical protein JB92DRAFT_2925191 [Gautieria morchelliformis]|nr:hypothetical protein JB92DRAFT_2925191 [Gautieria morchelliformis]